MLKFGFHTMVKCRPCLILSLARQVDFIIASTASEASCAELYKEFPPLVPFFMAFS